MTFEVSPDLREVMDHHPEVNWSAVFRDAILRHADTLEIARAIEAEQNDPRVKAVAEMLRKGVGERYRRAREEHRRNRR